MAQYRITVDSEDLQKLFRKLSGLDKLLKSILDQVLKAQVTEQVSAEPYERTEERQRHRNSSYPSQLTVRVGNITLRVPRIRDIKGANDHFYWP